MTTNKWTSRALSKRFYSEELDEATLNEVVVILMQGKNVYGDQIYSYLQLTMQKALELKKQMETDAPLNPSDFGTVIAAGKGFPSDELKAEMAATYNLIDAPPAGNANKPPRPPIPATTSFWGEEENEESSN